MVYTDEVALADLEAAIALLEERFAKISQTEPHLWSLVQTALTNLHFVRDAMEEKVS